MPTLSTRLRALRAVHSGPVEEALEMLQRAVDVEHLRDHQLAELLECLSLSMDWGSDELGVDPHGEALCVSFLRDEACCEHAPFIAALQSLQDGLFDDAVDPEPVVRPLVERPPAQHKHHKLNKLVN